MFLFSLESAAVRCIIAVWGAFERGCFPSPLQVATFFAAYQSACEMLSVEWPGTEL
jgi:hypothetical protein